MEALASTMVPFHFIKVDVGHYAIKFNRLMGLTADRYREGYNFKFPIIETPIIFNVQTRENEIFAETANRGKDIYHSRRYAEC